MDINNNLHSELAELKELIDKVKAEHNTDDISHDLDKIVSDIESLTEMSDSTHQMLGITPGEVIDKGKQAFKTFMDAQVDISKVIAEGGIFRAEGLEAAKRAYDNLNRNINGLFKGREGSRPQGPSGPGGGGGDYSPAFIPYSGQRAQNIQAAGKSPIDVEFNSPIKVRTYGDIDLRPDTNVGKTPLILNRHNLNFDVLYKEEVDSSGNLVYNQDGVFAQYVATLVNKLNYAAQMRVNFATSFTFAEVTKWLSTICDALNAYYGIYSIIQFEQDPSNRNEGMMHLRENISAEDFNQLDIFTNELAIAPKTANLVKLFYMINANWRWSDLPKSPILKFTSANINETSVMQFDIPSKIIALRDPEFRQVCNKIVRTVPDWTEVAMPMYGSETYQSPNFNTLWHNSAHIIGRVDTLASKVKQQMLPYLAENGSQTADFNYFSNTNSLDGLITSLFSIHYKDGSDVDKNWITGLFRPDYFSQKRSYKLNSIDYELFSNRLFYTANNKFEVCDGSSFPYRSFGFATHYDKDTDVLSYMGMDKDLEQIYGLSVNSLRQTSMEMVDWLFDIYNSPKGDEMQKNKSKRSRGTRGGKGKGKNSDASAAKDSEKMMEE